MQDKLLTEIGESIKSLKDELGKIENACKRSSQQKEYPRWQEEYHRVKAVVQKFNDIMAKRWAITFPYKVGEELFSNLILRENAPKGSGNPYTIKEIRECTVVLVSHNDRIVKITKEDAIKDYQCIHDDPLQY